MKRIRIRWFLGHVLMYLPLAVVGFAWVASLFGAEALRYRGNFRKPLVPAMPGWNEVEFDETTLAVTRAGLSVSRVWTRVDISLSKPPVLDFELGRTDEENLTEYLGLNDFLGFKWRLVSNWWSKRFVIVPFWFLVVLTLVPLAIKRLRQRPTGKRGFEVLSNSNK